MALLTGLQKLAKRLGWMRPVSLLLALAGLLLTVASLISQPLSSWLLSSCLLLLWSLLTYSFLTLFQNLPRVSPEAGFIKRLKTRLLIGFYGLLALVVFGLALTLIGFSLRSLILLAGHS
ncbi:hypothetical protein [Marinospirillum perlucidum]|uniref:hypothetical protein n=1 Tax=Marinospirillum perlucidum TaxID=1982602 RepID=UPI000DF15C92|nr:hypothetical protein [Marinospirillum perlucidum]